jgi:hypothetical protein
MAGQYDDTNRRHLSVATFSYLANQWTIVQKLHYTSGGGLNTFAYSYSHGSSPLNNVDSIVILRNGLGSGETEGTLRVIIDTGAGNLLDATTTAQIVDDEWNSVAVMASVSNVHVFINGVREQFAANVVALSPSTALRIGDATHGPDREWNGFIDETAMYDFTFSFQELEDFTATLQSPSFLDRPQFLHTEMFGPNDFGDVSGSNLSITDSSMLWGPQSPTVYPASIATYLGAPVIPTTPGSYAYYTLA